MGNLKESIDFFLYRSFGRKQTIINMSKRVESAFISLFTKNDRYIVNSIPKSGTHFIEKLLVNSSRLKRSGFFFSDIHHNRYPRDLSDYQEKIRFLGGKYFCGAHMPYSIVNKKVIAENKLKQVLLIRDPVDVLVSQYNHCLDRPTNRLHHVVSKCSTFREGVDILFDGYSFKGESDYEIPAVTPFIEYYQSYHKWLEQNENFAVVKFENLISFNDKELWLAELQRLFEFVGARGLSPEELEAAFSNSYGRSNTFKSGKIGSWRHSVSTEDQKYVDSRLSSLREKFGY